MKQILPSPVALMSDIADPQKVNRESQIEWSVGIVTQTR